MSLFRRKKTVAQLLFPELRELGYMPNSLTATYTFHFDGIAREHLEDLNDAFLKFYTEAREELPYPERVSLEVSQDMAWSTQVGDLRAFHRLGDLDA